ncbi:hypothetical protein PT974_07921 [Cladobotryum mycophilum]|uniref:Calcium-mediated lectin domain-containing protein n=1 Tax=Cladobotryum mycophilum TaxID=491253 RepID=A0ABR0SBX3_9HYPO
MANSSKVQFVRITINGKPQQELSGAGEHRELANFRLDEAITSAEPEFTYGGNRSLSRLQFGGPYSVGRQNILIVTAENGDDSDYDDTVAQFTTQKPGRLLERGSSWGQLGCLQLPAARGSCF